MLDHLTRKIGLTKIFSSDSAKQKDCNSAEYAALSRITSRLVKQNEMTEIWEAIVKQALLCLQADRSTIFVWDEKRDNLDVQVSSTNDPQHEKTAVSGEKEVALKIKSHKNPLLIRTSKDFCRLSRSMEEKNEVTSLVGVPVVQEDQPLRIFILSRIRKPIPFRKEELDLLNVFGNLGLLAMKVDSLAKRAEEGITLRNNYEKYLDNILTQLQSLFKCEGNIIKEHVATFFEEQERENGGESHLEPNQMSAMESEEPSPPAGEELNIEPVNRRGGERIHEVIQVDFRNEFFGLTNNLSQDGAFIQIPNPLDLQEVFGFRLHLPDGGEAIDVKCKVIWSNKYGKETEGLPRGMGVKFLDLQAEAKNRIQEYIKERNELLTGEIT
jgi:Tfp pilus assembly protein PilZ